jgi:hypothetical protein
MTLLEYISTGMFYKFFTKECRHRFCATHMSMCIVYLPHGVEDTLVYGSLRKGIAEIDTIKADIFLRPSNHSLHLLP